MNRIAGLQLLLPGLPQSRRAKLLAAGMALVLVVTVGLAGSVFHAEDAASVPTRAVDKAARDAAVRAARDRALAAARTARISHAVRSSQPWRARERTTDASHAAALFATHSWYVAPPPPPPVAPPPPPAPEAPPFPYTFVGSYAPSGEQPVYFLSRADRVIDAHLGDRLDGVYELESAGAGSLVFNYLPLNIRQSVPTGVAP